MGVDYTAHYGFGVKVIEVRDITDTYHDVENLEEHLKNTDYLYFQVGSGAYTGEDNEIYIIHKDVIDKIDKDNSYQFLETVAEEMVSFLVEAGIEFEGVPNIVGGLEIC